jgi:hypothetical protein
MPLMRQMTKVLEQTLGVAIEEGTLDLFCYFIYPLVFDIA